MLSRCLAEKSVLLAELQKYREKDRSKQLEAQLDKVSTNLKETTLEIQNKMKKINELEMQVRKEKIKASTKEEQTKAAIGELAKSEKIIKNLEQELKKKDKSFSMLQSYFNEAS